MIPPVNIRFENLPEIRVDFSEQFSEIKDLMVENVLEHLAVGGKPAWERTKYGAIPRLYDRFADSVKGESDSRSAEVEVGRGMPDTFAHQFGANISQAITQKQKGFFWHKFYETDDEMWRAMALSDILFIRLPVRKLIPDFTKEDKDSIGSILSKSILNFKTVKESTFGSA